MATDPFFFDVPNRGLVQIANGDASGLKTVATGAAAGTKVVAMIAQSTDTSDRDVQIGITNGATFYPLGTATVKAGAGNSGAVPAVNLLDPGLIVGLPTDNDGNAFIFLADPNDTLQAKALTTVTSAKIITVTAVLGDASA